MRVHEFAKLHGLDNKQLLDALKKERFEIKNHMSALSGDAVAFLEKIFLNKVIDSVKSKKDQSHKQVGSVQKVLNKNKSNYSSHLKPTIQKIDPIKIEPKEKVPFVIKAMSPGDFAQQTETPVTEVILTLLRQGKVCAINQLLPEADIAHLCQVYDIVTAQQVKHKDALSPKVNLSIENTEKRLPVVVVMGHVDHGKTTLLDFIRNTRVAAREKGGITQHLGAYEVATSHGNLVFLDTPGHEAFSKIRKRGASVADIAILVIAADDGIMPQTVESIKAIKALDIPVIVAINKVDRVDAQRIEVVKRQLTQYDLLCEEWGGQVMCIPISGKTGMGVEHLLEMIALQSEMMDLQASLTAPVRGYVLEAKMLKGRGAVATVLLQQGTLQVGDFFKAAEVVGKVTTITDSSGKSLKNVGPSVPVQIAGFVQLPEIGQLFEVITEQDFRNLRAMVQKSGFESSQLSSSSEDGQKLRVIIKADTRSSLEAILDAIKKFPHKETKEIVVIRSGIGTITESDALLAESTDAIIIGFTVKAESKAILAARTANIEIHLYDIIYKLLEEFEQLAAREKEVKTVLTKIGQATVLKVFNVKKLGVIAGCVVNDGRFAQKGIVAAIRDRKEFARGKIKSLQRDKKTVKEVHTGFECAFIVEGIEDWQEGDIAECYLNIVS